MVKCEVIGSTTEAATMLKCSYDYFGKGFTEVIINGIAPLVISALNEKMNPIEFLS